MSRFSQFITGLTSIIGFNSKKIALDLGSANTRVAVDNHVIYDQPSCLLINNQDDVISVGNKALKYLGKTSRTFRVFFPIEKGIIKDKRLIQLYLKALFKELKDKKLVKISWLASLNVGIMSGSFPHDREIFLESFKRAGFRNVNLINKSRAYKRLVSKKHNFDNCCVIDLGAQTIEMSLIINKKIVADNTIKIGGVNLTEEIQDFLHSEYQLKIGWQTAEKVKQELRLEGTAKEMNYKLAVVGKNLISNLTEILKVKYLVFSDILEQFADAIIEEIKIFFDVVPAEVMIQALDGGVYLTGAGSKLYGLDVYLEEKLKVEVIKAIKAEHDLVNGLLYELKV